MLFLNQSWLPCCLPIQTSDACASPAINGCSVFDAPAAPQFSKGERTCMDGQSGMLAFETIRMQAGKMHAQVVSRVGWMGTGAEAYSTVRTAAAKLASFITASRAIALCKGHARSGASGSGGIQADAGILAVHSRACLVVGASLHNSDAALHADREGRRQCLKRPRHSGVYKVSILAVHVGGGLDGGVPAGSGVCYGARDQERE